MATHIEELYNDLLLALRAAHTYVDLSTSNGTPRVIVDGKAELPTRAPWLVLGPPQDLSVTVDEVGHRHYRVQFKVLWVGYVAAATDSTFDRTLRATELADDVIRAVNTAWTTTNGTYDFIHLVTELTHRCPTLIGGSSGDGLAVASAEGEIEFNYSALDGI